jgi:hypothetical protein
VLTALKETFSAINAPSTDKPPLAAAPTSWHGKHEWHYRS